MCVCVCVCFSVFIAVDFMSSCNILILLLNRVVRSGFYVSAECQFPSMLYIPKAGYFVFEYFSPFFVKSSSATSFVFKFTAKGRGTLIHVH